MENLKNLENKFLLVDFEGFYFFNNFFIKEFGYFELKKINTLYVKTKPLNYSNYFWLLKHHHKLPHDFGTESFKTVLDILKKEDQIILVKGEEKAKYLQTLTSNIVINIEIFGCPAFKSLHSDNFPCIYHAIVPSEHCVRTKISKILNWIHNEPRTIEIATRFA
jgi:hypothetical protein